MLNPWCDLWQLIQRASAYVITGKYQKYLVGHVFVENLSRIGTNKRSHRNVIQAPQTPAPEKGKKNKREHDNVAQGTKKKICAFRNQIENRTNAWELHSEIAWQFLSTTFALWQEHKCAIWETAWKTKTRAHFFFCQLTTKASQKNRWEKRRQLTR